MKKVVVFGYRGMLGNYVFTYLKQTGKYSTVIGFDRTDCDILKMSVSKLEYFLREFLDEDTVVVNCIGVIPQASKQHGNLSARQYITINTLFPCWLDTVCSKYGSRVVHPTTDCVYSGNSVSRYTEVDQHDETSLYGVSKSLGEVDSNNTTVIRTSIIGEETRNKRSLLEWVKSNKNKEVNGYTNHMWNGITCLQFAKIVHQLIQEDILWNGVRHIFSPSAVSKYQLVSMISDVYGLNVTVNPFQTPESCNKTVSTVYNDTNFLKIPELKDQIRELEQFKL